MVTYAYVGIRWSTTATVRRYIYTVSTGTNHIRQSYTGIYKPEDDLHRNRHVAIHHGQVAFTNPESSNWSRNTHTFKCTTRTSTAKQAACGPGAKLFNMLSPSPRFALLLRILTRRPLLCVPLGETIRLHLALRRTFKWQGRTCYILSE